MHALAQRNLGWPQSLVVAAEGVLLPKREEASMMISVMSTTHPAIVARQIIIKIVNKSWVAKRQAEVVSKSQSVTLLRRMA
jgi:hypothetical protein